MGAVFAIEKDGVVYLGADTQTTYGSREKRAHLSPGSLKLLALPNGIILGRVGKVHSTQYIWAHPEWFTLPKDGVLTKQHVVNEIVPHIYHCFRDNDLFKHDKESPLSMGNALLLAYKDKLFVINERLGVVVVEHYAAIGAGDDFVQYGLSHMDKTRPIQGEIKRLLRLAATCCASVGAPFAFVDTLSRKIKLER